MDLLPPELHIREKAKLIFRRHYSISYIEVGYSFIFIFMDGSRFTSATVNSNNLNLSLSLEIHVPVFETAIVYTILGVEVVLHSNMQDQ